MLKQKEALVLLNVLIKFKTLLSQVMKTQITKFYFYLMDRTDQKMRITKELDCKNF